MSDNVIANNNVKLVVGKKSLNLGIYKLHPDVILPEFKTKGSACFDIAFSCAGLQDYEGFDEWCSPWKRYFHTGKLTIGPNERVKAPTGLIFDIPEGYSLRIYMRSSSAYKYGLSLVNGQGIIDSDYIDPLYLLLINETPRNITINNGERLCQAELVKSEIYTLREIKKAPTQKTDRVGGIGSTGA